jgi:hypothetical protein
MVFSQLDRLSHSTLIVVDTCENISFCGGDDLERGRSRVLWRALVLSKRLRNRRKKKDESKWDQANHMVS